MVRRWTKSACVAFVVAILCTGCFKVEVPLAPGLMSVGRDGDLIEISACKAMVITGISAGERKASGNEWVTFWKGEGRLTVSRGDVINSETLRSLLGDTDATDPALRNVRLEILFSGEQKSENILGTFDIGDDGIPESSWLQLDGSLTEEPCP